MLNIYGRYQIKFFGDKSIFREIGFTKSESIWIFIQPKVVNSVVFQEIIFGMP